MQNESAAARLQGRKHTVGFKMAKHPGTTVHPVENNKPT
jgi:hypothetical protein